jgi:hypothetical protein
MWYPFVTIFKLFSGRSAAIAMKRKAEERHIAIFDSTEIPR